MKERQELQGLVPLAVTFDSDLVLVYTGGHLQYSVPYAHSYLSPGQRDVYSISFLDEGNPHACLLLSQSRLRL